MPEGLLEKRVEELAARVEQLQDRVDELAGGMVKMVSEVAADPPASPVMEDLTAQVERLRNRVDELANGMVRVATEVAPHAVDEGKGKGEGHEDIVAWAGTSSLLPRISTLCFLLVVALALRTVTDSGMIGKHLGSVIGMVYAASIMFVGWLRYRKGSPIAPVFSISGAFLMYSIVVETHTHFGSLPTLPAHLLIAATGLFMALTSRTAGSAAPMAVGTLGMAVAGVALNIPVSSLPLLAFLLFLANLIAYRLSPLLKRDWLRWALFVITGMVVQVWSFRVAVAVTNPDIPSAPLQPLWFVPTAALFGAFFFTTSIRRILAFREGSGRMFDYVIPTLSAVVFFTAARHVAVPLWGGGLGLGLAGLVVASAHMATASWMVKGKKLTALEFNSFTVAAVVLLVLSLSAATGALLAALPFLSAAAFHLAVISDRWQSGGTRVISYFLQVFVAFALALMLAGGAAGVPFLLAALAAGAVGTLAFLHYRWCRRTSPPADSIVFSRFDTRDYSGSTLLLASLIGWFFLLRIGAWQIIDSTVGSAGGGNAFSGVQSLIINFAAIALLVTSYILRNREVRNIALLIAIIGGAKVFFYDLVGVEGLPRVLSVFSFGIVAAVASWVLGRWQKGGSGGVSPESGEAEPAAGES